MAHVGAADDLTIPATALLWRRIFPRGDYLHTEADGRVRASSLAFDDNGDDPMSMYLADEAKDPGLLLQGHEAFGIASITAQELRDQDLIIVRNPDVIPGHVLVIGPKPHPVRRILAKAAEIIWAPTLQGANP